MPGPDFIIVGAMKAGTTALFNTFKIDEQFNMCSVKEPNFFHSFEQFGGTWNMGRSWYESLFPDKCGLRGEASTSYTKGIDSQIFARMCALYPRLKIIYLLRNPVDRCISHYLHNLIARESLTPRVDFQALLRRKAFIETSRYYSHLQLLRQKYPDRQILLVISERLWAKREREMDRIFKFLGCQIRESSQMVEVGQHRTFDKLSYKMPSLIEPLARCKNSFWDVHALDKSTVGGSRRLALNLGMTEDVSNALREVFAQEVGQLRTHMSDNIEEWDD